MEVAQQAARQQQRGDGEVLVVAERQAAAVGPRARRGRTARATPGAETVQLCEKRGVHALNCIKRRAAAVAGRPRGSPAGALFRLLVEGEEQLGVFRRPFAFGAGPSSRPPCRTSRAGRCAPAVGRAPRGRTTARRAAAVRRWPATGERPDHVPVLNSVLMLVLVWSPTNAPTLIRPVSMLRPPMRKLIGP